MSRRFYRTGREVRAGEARKALAGEGGVADNSVGEAREVRAEETRKVRETGEIFRQSAEAKAEAEENAAVLEILEKNGAFANFLSEAEEIAEEGGEVVVDETVAELIAGGGEAVYDNTAGKRVEKFTVESSVGRGTSRRRV